MEQQRYDERYATEQDPAMMDGQRDGQALSTADLAGTAQPAAEAPMAADTMREQRPSTATQPTQTSEADTGPLLDEAESQQLRSRWDAVQTGFVDEPRQAVEQADQLVAEAMKRLAEVFATER